LIGGRRPRIAWGRMAGVGCLGELFLGGWCHVSGWKLGLRGFISPIRFYELRIWTIR
jgi:hypothetical protein